MTPVPTADPNKGQRSSPRFSQLFSRRPGTTWPHWYDLAPFRSRRNGTPAMPQVPRNYVAVFPGL
ncbi:MAG TPA: hypothetical protein VIY86_13460, partial [Pirellulaceae bacterium]